VVELVASQPKVLAMMRRPLRMPTAQSGPRIGVKIVLRVSTALSRKLPPRGGVRLADGVVGQRLRQRRVRLRHVVADDHLELPPASITVMTPGRASIVFLSALVASFRTKRSRVAQCTTLATLPSPPTFCRMSFANTP